MSQSNLLRRLTITSIGGMIGIIGIQTTAQAYQFFTDRNDWNTAVIQSTIVTETFDYIPPGTTIPPGTVFLSGLEYLNGSGTGDLQTVGTIIDTELDVCNFFPVCGADFALPTPVEALGFDFSTSGGQTLSVEGVDSFGEQFLGSGDSSGFFGVVAEAGDNLIQNFTTFGGSLTGGTNLIDNVSTANADTMPIPEPSTLLGLTTILGMGVLSKKSKKNQN